MHREVTETITKFLAKRPGKQMMADCTFGGGGHSSKLLDLNSNLRVIGVDLDPEIIE